MAPVFLCWVRNQRQWGHLRERQWDNLEEAGTGDRLALSSLNLPNSLLFCLDFIFQLKKSNDEGREFKQPPLLGNYQINTFYGAQQQPAVINGQNY